MSEREIFSEDIYYGLCQNAGILIHRLDNALHNAKTDAEMTTLPLQVVTAVRRNIEEWSRFGSGFNHFYNIQFKCGKRKICPNKDCASSYAYFYDDFKFCPKCGYKLIEGVKDEQ